MTIQKYHRYRRPISTTKNPGIAWYKSPLILGSIALSILGIGGFLIFDFLTPRVIHISATDSSDSMEKYKEVRKDACQAAVHNYKSGDRLVELAVADRSFYLGSTEIDNTLGLLNKCTEQRPISSDRPGTSAAALLTLAATTVEQERQQGRTLPVVLTFIIQAAETVPGETPFNAKTAKQQVESILTQGGSITFLVQDPDLRTELHQALDGIPKVKVTDFSGITANIDSSFTIGRKK